MKNKKTLWLSLALSIPLALSPLAALAQQDAPPPPPQAGPGAPPPDLRGLQPPPPPRTPAIDTDRAAYRLTYTLTEMDGEKRLGSQHYALVLDTDAPPANLKLGERIPIYLNQASTDFQYSDIGLNIRASLRQFANGLELRTKVDQSALDAEASNTKAAIIRQTSLESAVLLNEGHPVVLGEMDTPGSSRHMQITVVLSKVP